MRVVLDPANLARVQSYTPFMFGGVPGDKGAVTGPNPQVQPNAAYRGAGLLRLHSSRPGGTRCLQLLARAAQRGVWA